MLAWIGPGYAPSVNNSLHVRSGQYWMVVKKTQQDALNLVFFLLCHSRLLRERELSKNCFVVVVQFKSLDELCARFQCMRCVDLLANLRT